MLSWKKISKYRLFSNIFRCFSKLTFVQTFLLRNLSKRIQKKSLVYDFLNYLCLALHTINNCMLNCWNIQLVFNVFSLQHLHVFVASKTNSYHGIFSKDEICTLNFLPCRLWFRPLYRNSKGDYVGLCVTYTFIWRIRRYLCFFYIVAK